MTRPVYLFRCSRCGAEHDNDAPSGLVPCPSCSEGRTTVPMKRVYQSGVGRVSGAGGSPGRASRQL